MGRSVGRPETINLVCEEQHALTHEDVVEDFFSEKLKDPVSSPWNVSLHHDSGYNRASFEKYHLLSFHQLLGFNMFQSYYSLAVTHIEKYPKNIKK